MNPAYLFDILLEEPEPKALVEFDFFGMPALFQVSLPGQHLQNEQASLISIKIEPNKISN